MSEKWVPENLEQLERYAKMLEETTASTITNLDALTLTMIGFSFSRAVDEMRTARAAGFNPENTVATP